MLTVQQLIDNALVEKPRERSGKFSPSSFGMCYRQQFWNRKNEPKSEPSDERSLRVFKAGQLFHDFVQGLICDSAEDSSIQFYQKEAIVNTQPDILGYADLVGKNEVIDIKSQHSKSFWYMAKMKSDADIRKEKYNNWLQVGYYARELNKEFMRLVFISKDDLCIKEFVQKLDDYWLQEIDTEINNLRTLWLNVDKYDHIPYAKPRCEPNKKGEYWHCTYCGWWSKCCQVEKEAGREHPSPKPEKVETETEL